MRAETTTVNRLSSAEAGQMFSLYSAYFEATAETIFRKDLAEKEYVILLRDAAGSIQGFSTGAVLNFTTGETRGRAIFSGDTIIHHQHWGELTLPLAFAAQAGRIKAEQPETPLYWFLISMGYRTYRYLPLFFHDYFPRWDQPTPAEPQRLLDTLACGKFGAAYDSRTGVIRYPESRGQLRGAWGDVRESMMRKPEVCFFLEKNPGYRNGDELACLAELSAENIRPIARRAFLEAFHGELAAIRSTPR
jgi:hypothetical protein